MPEISLIIPYYNEDSAVFNKCMDSVLNQTFSDFEVIIINDGSEEQKAKYLNTFESSDNRIKIFHQANQGVSVARNNGVKIARGKYIAFVDADDVLLPYFLEDALKYVKENNADIVYGFIYKTLKEDYLPPRPEHPSVRKIDDKWLKKYIVGYLYGEGQKRYGRGPWARLIKSNIAKSAAFPPGVPIGEDVLWNLKICTMTTEKYLVDEIWYLYILRSGSATNKYNPKIEEKLLPFYNELDKYLSKEDIDNYYNRVFRDLSRYVFMVYLGHKENGDSFIKRWREFNQVCSRDPWNGIGSKEFFLSANMKNRVKIVFFKLRLLFPIWTMREEIYRRKGRV